jgi:xanthine dehydrogenase/oxidase
MELAPTIQSIFRKTSLEFYVNGTSLELSDPNPQWTLLDFIRSQHGLKGTKLGCGEGGCGACTVVLQCVDENSRRLKHLAVNACLFPLIGGRCLGISSVDQTSDCE